MEMLLRPRDRDVAIEITCMNMVLAGDLEPVATTISQVSRLTDDELVWMLRRSLELYRKHLAQCWHLN